MPALHVSAQSPVPSLQVDAMQAMQGWVSYEDYFQGKLDAWNQPLLQPRDALHFADCMHGYTP